MTVKSSIAELDPADVQTVGQALIAAVEGPFFPDWEFETLIGVERATVRTLAQSWPDLVGDEESEAAAVVNVLNNLVGYPHGRNDDLERRVPGGSDQIAAVLDRLLDAGF